MDEGQQGLDLSQVADQVVDGLATSLMYSIAGAAERVAQSLEMGTLKNRVKHQVGKVEILSASKVELLTKMNELDDADPARKIYEAQIKMIDLQIDQAAGIKRPGRKKQISNQGSLF